ncbi:MAG: peptidylprolyl isomerase [Planctomycetota bacterium]
MTTIRSIVRRLCLIAVIATAATVIAPAHAQSSSDDAFAPLQEEFFNLFRSLQNQQGIRDGDEQFVRDLMDRMTAFASANPDDPRPVAAAFAMSDWIQDDEARVAAISRLIALIPENTQMVLDYGRRLKQKSAYADAITLFVDTAPVAITSSVDAALLYADCLYCENRFDDAIAALTAALEIPGISDADKTRLESQSEQYTTKLEQWNEELAIRSTETEADTMPRAEIVTSKGIVLVELFEDAAPNTVANFITLAEEGYYDNIRFHRVMGDFMSQGGNATERVGLEDPSTAELPKRIPDEHTGDEFRRHFAGTLAMANTGAPNSGAAQFYLCHRPTDWLDGRHTVFGRILEGLDIARAIEQGEDVIETVRIVRKGDGPYDVQYADEMEATANLDPADGDADEDLDLNTTLDFESPVITDDETGDGGG